MFTQTDDLERARKYEEKMKQKKNSPTKLFSKVFTHSEWDKLENIIIPGTYNKTVQDIIQEKYTVTFIDDVSVPNLNLKDEKTKIELKETKERVKILLKENKVLARNGNKLKDRILKRLTFKDILPLYHEQKSTLSDFINNIKFEKVNYDS